MVSSTSPCVRAGDIFEEAKEGKTRERYLRQPSRFRRKGIPADAGGIVRILDEAGISHGEPEGKGYLAIPLKNSRGEKIGGINVAKVGDEYVISGINRVASREDARGIPTKAVQAIVNRAMGEGAAVRAASAEIASPFWEKMGFVREGKDFVRRPAGAFKLEETARDKGFKNFIKKNRLGLVKVSDNDLKLWERALSLPFWLQDKYKELRPLVHTQMKREESRSEIIHGF